MSDALADVLILIALLVLLVAALEVGFLVGRRANQQEDPNGVSQVGAIQGAILGMLGLLLAFSFAAAGSRFMERQDQIVAEANAIGTAYLRAALLDAAHAAELRTALRDYAAHRLTVFQGGAGGSDPATLAEVDALHGRIWRAAQAGVEARPGLALTILNPVNEVIDLHATRLASSRKHLPYLVLGLLVACSTVALAVMGYSACVGGRRRLPLNLTLTLLIASALWVTIDLDYPRRGLIRLDDAPLEALHFETP